MSSSRAFRRRPTSSACAGGALLAAALMVAAPLHAQIVRGNVVDAAGRPAAGVVLALLDSSDVALVRGLSGERGDYSIRAPSPGTFRLRALRVGFRPVTSEPFTLAAGESGELRFDLDGIRVELQVVRVEERAVCGRGNAGDASVFAAWDQAMTSVTAASLTTAARALTVTSLSMVRTVV